MDEQLDRTRTAAAGARMVLLRLASEGGLLHQIETGAWDERIAPGSSEVAELLDAMRERARLDRIILDRFASGR